MLFRSWCPSPNSGYPFCLLVLTFRSSRPAYGGRLTSPVSHETEGVCMNFLIYVFWLAASVGMAIAIDKLLSPSQVIYSIGIYFIFLIMFGIQKKTYVKKSGFKLLKWDLYNKFELIEQNHILGIPLGKGTILEVQRELFTDKEVADFITGKLVPLAFSAFGPKVGLAKVLLPKKK